MLNALPSALSRASAFAALLVLVAFSPSLSCADTLTWTGAGDGQSFHQATNWSPAQTPTSNDDCTIPAGAGTIRLSVGASVRSLTTSRAVSVDSCSELAIGVELSLQGGITVSLNNPCGLPGLAFGSGPATISGSGTISIVDAGINGTTITVRNNSSLTIGSGITVSYGPQSFGSGAQIRVDAGCTITNQGTIWARQATQKLAIVGNGTFANSGTAKATAGELQIATAAWTNTGSIQATNAVLTFSGSWSNSGAVSLTSATWNVGGDYPELGTVQRTGGFIFITNVPQSGTLVASASTGNVNLPSGPLTGVTLQSSGGASFVATTTTLNACVLVGRLMVSDTLVINNGLTLQNNAVVTGDRLTLGGTSQAVTGSGELAFQNVWITSVATLENGVILKGVPGKNFLITITDHSSLRNKATISAAGVTVCNIAGAGVLLNEGTMLGPGSGVSLVMIVAHWTNSGPLEAEAVSISGQVTWTNSSTITCSGAASFSGSWINEGTIQVGGATSVFNGTWKNNGLIKLMNTAATFNGTYSSLGQFERTGGSFTISGNYTGTELEANPLTGDLSLTSLQLNQCELRATAGANLRMTGHVQMRDCTLRSDIALLSCSTLSVLSNLTLADDAVATISRGPNTCAVPAILFSTGNASISGNGEFVVNSEENLVRLDAGAKATIGSGIAIRISPTFSKAAANIVLADATAELTNQGTIALEKANVTLSISGGKFRNQGVLHAAAGTLQVTNASGEFGALEVATGAVAKISGNPFIINLSPTLASGSRLELSGTYTINAPINAINAFLSLLGTWTNNAAFSALQSGVTLGGTWTNNDTITLTDSTVNLAGSFTNVGTVTVVNSAVTMNTAFPTTGMNFINSTLIYSGTFAPGVVLEANASTGDIAFANATLTSSILRSRDGKRFLTAPSHAITLNACTLDGELAVTSCGTINVVGGLTFADGILRLNNACPQGLVFSIGQAISGTGAIIADGASSTTAQIIATSSAITIASGVSLQISPASAGAGISRVFFSSSGGSWTTQGSILHRAPGRELVFSGVGTVSTTGLVETTGGKITISSSGITNFSGNRLTGGTWRAINAPINFGTREIRQIAANTELVLEGPLGDIPQLLPLDSNSGTLRIRNRTHAVKPASVFSNSGLLDLASDATLAITGRMVFASASTFRTQIAGLNSNQVGRITATTGATLNGKLQGSFAPGYTPLASDETAPLITAPSFSGSFASTCFDANPFGLGVQPIIDTGIAPNELSLIITAASGTFPVLTESPTDTSATPNALFHAAAAPSNAALQWKRNNIALANGPTGSGSTISGATTPTLTILNAQPSDVGAYTISLTNSCGTLTSNPAQLRLCTGDLNSDGMVDDADFLLFLAGYTTLDCADPAMPPLCPADFNTDSVVDDTDFTLFIPAYDALLCP